MKRLLFSIFGLLTLVVGIAQQNYTIDVKDFGELKVIDGVNVTWKCSADSAGLVTFSAEPDMVSNILLTNNKNQLKIALQDTEFPLKRIPELTVYSNFLSKVDNSGDSTVTLQTPPPSAEIKLRVVGNGRIVAQGLHATTVDAKIDTGCGQIVLQGVAQWLKLRTAGSGNIEGANLQADYGAFTVVGTGNIDCWITRELTIKGLGSGKVYSKGKPQIKNRTLGTVKVIAIE